MILARSLAKNALNSINFRTIIAVSPSVESMNFAEDASAEFI